MSKSAKIAPRVEVVRVARRVPPPPPRPAELALLEFVLGRRLAASELAALCPRYRPPAGPGSNRS